MSLNFYLLGHVLERNNVRYCTQGTSKSLWLSIIYFSLSNSKGCSYLGRFQAGVHGLEFFSFCVSTSSPSSSQGLILSNQLDDIKIWRTTHWEILWARSRSGTHHIHSHFTGWNSITWPNLDVMKTGKYSHTVGSEKKRRWVWRLAEGHIYPCTIDFLIKILNDTIMLLKLYVAFKIQEYYIANLLHIEI